MIEEKPGTVANQVGRGLVPGVQEKDAVVIELERAQALAARFALDEARQDVAVRIAGLAAALVDQAAEVILELHHRAVAALEHFWSRTGLEPGEDGDRPGAQRAALVGGD